MSIIKYKFFCKEEPDDAIVRTPPPPPPPTPASLQKVGGWNFSKMAGMRENGKFLLETGGKRGKGEEWFCIGGMDF